VGGDAGLVVSVAPLVLAPKFAVGGAAVGVHFVGVAVACGVARLELVVGNAALVVGRVGAHGIVASGRIEYFISEIV